MPSTDVEPTRPKGLLSGDPLELARRTTRAWELFAEAVAAADLDSPTRSSTRSARQMITALGSWPDSRGIRELIADAHAGATAMEPFKQASARLAATHAGAGDDEVRGSVLLSLEQTQAWLASGDLQHTGHLPTPSPLGPLPVGTVVHAAAYQLAVTARDLIPAGAEPLPELDEIGLVALLDAAGAVGARSGLVARASAVGRRAAVSCDIIDGGWTATLADDPGFPAVIGPEELLVDLAGGRADFAALTRQLRFRDARGLLALSPVVDAVPDLPGGPLLKRVAQFARVFGGRR